jgi:hypothetical protein
MKKLVLLKTGTANFHQSLQLKEEKAGIAEKEMIGAADSIADATGIGVQLKSKWFNGSGHSFSGLAEGGINYN